MKIIIDLEDEYKNDPALCIFTKDVFVDLAKVHLQDYFLFVQHEAFSEVPFPENMGIKLFKPTGIAWLDRHRHKTIARKFGANFVVKLKPDHWEIRSMPSAAEKKLYFVNDPTADLRTGITVSPVMTALNPDAGWPEQESTRTNYCGGHAFFLFVGNLDANQQLVELLKAFSIFKKWQQSSMQLVLAGYHTRSTRVLEEKLLNYKYRNDIHLLKDPAEEIIAKLSVASYAMLAPGSKPQFPAGLLWAKQFNKVIIATDSNPNRLVGAATEWLSDNTIEEALASAMKKIYKDESYLQSLIRNNGEHKTFNRWSMLDDVWRYITE